MIDKEHDLSIVKHAKVLGLSRSGVYYEPRSVSDADLALMRHMDELHLSYPFAGSRMLAGLLRAEGHSIGRLHLDTLIRKMGLSALYRRPNTTKREARHKIYPYLLYDLPITKANQVWATDITYIPMKKGFVYLVAVMDWFTRKVLSWKLSNSMGEASPANGSREMTNDFCMRTLQEAITKYGTPEIFNTDQGSQFTCPAFTDVLKKHDIKISMDGKGAWRDNVFVERLWKSVKYEEVYLRAYDNVADARANLAKYLTFYNTKRLHQALDRNTPDNAYFNPPQPIPVAA
jgi:putative transposase